MGFPGGSVGKESACNVRHRRHSVGKIPWRRATHSSILAWRIMDRGAWRARVNRIEKSQPQLK